MSIEMIARAGLESAVHEALRRAPVVALVGPRQCGKTTLARRIALGREATLFDLENPIDLARLANPVTTLGALRGLVVIDEMQRRPDLFEILRVLVDRPRSETRFLVLGGAAPGLIRGTSESLAGRVHLLEMTGFDLREVGADRWRDLWIRGGFPRSFLADSEADSLAWRHDFVSTFLERDVPQLGIHVPAVALRRFWSMVAHYHGQVWNASEFARSIGASESTARRYLDILTGAFVVRQLPAWFANLSKRQVKAPKLYIRDSGLLHALLDLPGSRELEGHPKVGASFEGLAIAQILAAARPREAYFWATHGGAELDLLLFRDGEPLGFEIKYTESPRVTPSMRSALESLDLARLYVVTPGPDRFEMAERIEAIPLPEMVAGLETPR